jgi:hypothetical protein
MGEFVKLQGLGNQEVMGKLIKNVEIKIGQLTILWDVFTLSNALSTS